MSEENKKIPVLTPDEIVPFFINIRDGDQRLFEVLQLRLCDVDPEKITNTLTRDLSLPPNFSQAVFSFVESQFGEYQKLTELFPDTEWANKGSAVHCFQIEASTESVIYCDQFDWDIFDRTADPDAFAQLTIQELALPAEFVNVLSAQIRHQIIKFRSMHAFPDKFMEYIKTNPLAAPQIHIGFRPVSDLLDVSPAVGLKPGSETKSSTSSRERDMRAQRRQNRTIQTAALRRADDTVIEVSLVPVVRAIPMPEDSTNIDLPAVPQLLADDEPVSQRDIDKVFNKLDQAKFMPAPSQLSRDESDADDFY